MTTTAPESVAWDLEPLVDGEGEAGAVELGDLAGVLGGEGGGAAVGLGEEAIGAGGAFAVDERIEVPGDVSDVSGGHADNPSERIFPVDAGSFSGRS